MSLEFRNTPQERLPDEEVHELVVQRTEEQFGELTPAPVAKVRRSWLPIVGLTILAALAVGAHFGTFKTDSLPTRPFEGFAKPGTLPYGPDISTELKIDTSFSPGGELPQGLALTAETGHIMWGCGNRRVGGAQPPDGAPRESVRKRVRELIEHVRSQASRRGIQAHNPWQPNPIHIAGPSTSTTFCLEWRNGGATETAEVPLSDTPAANAERDRLADRLTRKLCDSVADSIQWLRSNDPNLP